MILLKVFSKSGGWAVRNFKKSALSKDFFDNPFSKCLFLKEFLGCNGYFGLSVKFKKELGISFWSTFSVWFFHRKFRM